MLRLVAAHAKVAGVMAEPAPPVVFEAPPEVPQLADSASRILTELIRRRSALDAQADQGNAAA